MSRFTVEEAAAWGEATKLNIEVLDTNLAEHLETEVLARLNVTVDTSTWTNDATTPKIVRTALSKMYTAYIIHRQYAEDDDANVYAVKLETNAEMIIKGIIDGTIEVPGASNEVSQPSFYPNDFSSSQRPTPDDRSLGPAAFSMGQIF